jgi:hypothetical protein
VNFTSEDSYGRHYGNFNFLFGWGHHQRNDLALRSDHISSLPLLSANNTDYPWTSAISILLWVNIVLLNLAGILIWNIWSVRERAAFCKAHSFVHNKAVCSSSGENNPRGARPLRLDVLGNRYLAGRRFILIGRSLWKGNPSKIWEAWIFYAFKLSR